MTAQIPDLPALERNVGYAFHDRALLRRALRHGSAESASDEGSYQRLEFLGDAVLGASLAQLLYERFPEGDQGALTRMKAQLARSETLARKALEAGLGELIELGQGEEATGGRRRRALLEDVFEALVGAIFLDGGWEPADGFVVRTFTPELDALDERTLRLADPKTALQEEAQARQLPLPEYREVGAGGPDHKPVWAFEVVWRGEPLARGEGSSKREAQQEAARRALLRLGLVDE